MSDTKLLEIGRRVLSSQPFSVLLDVRLHDFSEGEAELRVPLSPKLGQQHGHVHGGVVSYASDNAMAFAAGSVLGPAVVSSESKINYLRPAPAAGVLVARAMVVHHGSRQAVCRCEVSVRSEGAPSVLCAVAQGTVVRTGS